MSATSEIMNEEIRGLEQILAEGRLSRPELDAAEKRLIELKRNFSAATQALTEGRSILKG